MTAALAPLQTTLLAGGLRLGIDPGKYGAIAAVDDARFYGIWRFPRCAFHDREIVDAEKLTALLRSLRADYRDPVTYVEEIRGFRTMAPDSTLSMGVNLGALYAALAASGLNTRLIPPARWKARARVTRRKVGARDRAAQLYPECYADVRRDDNAAEAVLIAHVGPELFPDDNPPTTEREEACNGENDPF